VSARWSPAESFALRRLYPTATCAEILSALPGRTWPGIKHRASLIGVKRELSAAHKHTTDAHRQRIKQDTDRRVLDFVIDYTARYGFGPMLTEIAEEARVAHSTAGVSVARLVERGLLIRNPGKSRAVGLHPALRRRIEQRRAA
jgi:hypothetical protein